MSGTLLKKLDKSIPAKFDRKIEKLDMNRTKEIAQ